MSGAESDPVVSKDESPAALAEVDEVSGEEAARISGLDGSRENTDGPATALAERQPPGFTSDIENTTTYAEHGASRDEAEIGAALEQLEALAAATDASPAERAAAARAGSADGAAPAAAESTTTLSASLGDEQLRAASAELEAISSTAKDASPRRAACTDDNADDGRPEGVSEKAATAETAVDEKRGAGAPRTTRANPNEAPFESGKPAGDGGAAAARSPDKAGVTGAAQGLVPSVTSLARRVYRAVDRGLDRIHRPFEGLDERKRALVGWVAVTTLIVSILAMVLVPKLLPHRDAITFLQEKRAELESPPPPEAPGPPGAEH